jgi:UDP-GlcNAc:undecaprenyl-phosphate GlcNAc-1-phosphate transferase
MERTGIPTIIIMCLCAILEGVMFIPSVRNAVVGHGDYLRAFYLFLNSFGWTFLLVPFAIRFGFASQIVDHPDELRKHHGKVTPLTGGIAIYAGFAATILVNFEFSVEMKAILIASTLIFIVGLLDDRFGLSAKIRLLSQIIAASILIFAGVEVTFVPDALGGVVTEAIITIIWLIGITNAMNFIDGLDGLASGSSIIYSIFFAIVAVLTHQYYLMFMSVALAGSCLGFFPYNFRTGHRARVFLGDSGSTFLGFLLASFALLGQWGDSFTDLAVPVLIMSILIFDMSLTTIVRIGTKEVKSFGEWLHYTGRDHVHHRLLHLGLSDKGVVAVFLIVSISFGLEALVLLYSQVWTSVVLIIQTALMLGVFGFVLVCRNKQQ